MVIRALKPHSRGSQPYGPYMYGTEIATIIVPADPRSEISFPSWLMYSIAAGRFNTVIHFRQRAAIRYCRLFW